MAKKKTEEAYDFSQDADMGFENVSQEDLGIPFLKIIQSDSPELDETSAKYIDGAKVGDIFNASTREVLGGKTKPVVVCPCSYNVAYVEWRPKSGGGGIAGIHRDASILRQAERDENFKDVLENGNNIVLTKYIGVLVIEENGEKSPAVISMTSTQLKKAKQWLSVMNGIRLEKSDGTKFRPPFFSHLYELTTIREENAKGSWMGWAIKNIGLNTDVKLIAEAKAQTEQSNKLLVAAASAEDNGPEPF